MASLLAVDVGLRTGLALVGDDGRVRWYRSHHYGTRAALRAGVPGVLASIPDLVALALEGGGPIAEIWAAAGGRRGLSVVRVGAEVWRKRLLGRDGVMDRKAAKRDADALARRVIDWSGAPRPTSLRHDAAEAVLIGLWAALERGWLPGVPDGIG